MPPCGAPAASGPWRPARTRRGPRRMGDVPPLDAYLADARAWLAAKAEPRPERVERSWGEGSDSVALFHNVTYEEDKAIVDAARAWQQRKADAGYASIDWAPEHGGAGLPSGYARAF